MGKFQKKPNSVTTDASEAARSGEAQGKGKKSKRWLWLLLLVLSLALVCGAVLFLLFPQWFPFLLPQAKETDLSGINQDAPLPTAATEPPTEETETPTEPTEEPTTEEPTEPLPDNRVEDWSYYQSINPDVYAWIYVPNTGIDLPILQSTPAEDDNLYLRHNIYLEYDKGGALYTQKANAQDFSDPVTVIYGHNMFRRDSMFSNLLDFRDPDFFAETEFFYIYQPQRALTYRIVSAHAYDTRHILNTNDFSKEEDIRTYFDYILAPKTMIANVREGAELTTEDKVVTLSTCINIGGVMQRYLVQGVLVDDQQTN